ncbi:MAG: type II toxin-antitoxin system RelE/ParE family toxin [Candidatus Marinimicrobia bacterium]|jgi:mRNA interferase RelE/StbE|nr:type II toxin-antitoxin system RelE/ParE family toxin [Candidatus Neomarinimicrobiota bacterium]
MPSYKIQIEKRALKQLSSLPKQFKSRIKSVISSLAEKPRPSGIKKLHGKMGIYRIRQGRYRVILYIDDKNKMIQILKIGDRKAVYK